MFVNTTDQSFRMIEFHLYTQRLKPTYFKEIHSFVWNIPANIDEQTSARGRQVLSLLRSQEH